MGQGLDGLARHGMDFLTRRTNNGTLASNISSNNDMYQEIFVKE